MKVIFLLYFIFLKFQQNGKELNIAAKDGIRVFGEEFTSENSETIILLFHRAGGNAKAEYGGHIIPRLVDGGYSVIAVDQRKGGSSLGGVNKTWDHVLSFLEKI